MSPRHRLFVFSHLINFIMRFFFRFLLLAGFVVALSPALAQSVRGSVSEQTQTNTSQPLAGATLRWAGATTGTVTDSTGRFALPVSDISNRLIVSFVGYQTDTLTVRDTTAQVRILLRPDAQLREVIVSASGSSPIDRLNPIQTELITTRTLAKAACCNLSESFETNASVSVNYADAVTGARQIQFLGLGGQYVQTNVENIPTVRGFATTFGLNYIPGTWITSIDLGKGAGSVVNGYEAMTGQMNVELQKSDAKNSDGRGLLLLNGYANSFGRVEGNLNWSQSLGKRTESGSSPANQTGWSVATLAHASALQREQDSNGDGFRDLPLYRQLNLINRWKYASDRWMVQFGVKALYEDRDGGQTSTAPTIGPRYQFTSTTRRVEFFSKTARLFPDKPYRGLGLILNGLRHEQDATFGFRPYAGRQQSLYANLIYQDILGNTNHAYKAGLSYLLDDYQESFASITNNPTPRTESVPGAFVEYTYQHLDKLTLVLGGRFDYHNRFGAQWTPRLHAKYELNPTVTLRANAGRGWRVPNLLAENFGYLVSSRVLISDEYVLRPEVTWNYGLSLTNDFLLLDQKASLVLDYHRTDFREQLMIDLEHPREIHFHNLYGQSFANSFQAELNYQPIRRLDVKVAYRLFDVRQSMSVPSGDTLLLPKMMVPRDRVLLNVGYALPFDKWKFDATLQWNGQRRIPYLREAMRGDYPTVPLEYAPGFFNLNAQISRAFLSGWEVYLGGENLTGFRQTNPIIAASDPFGPNFDAAGRAWGPVTGAMVYVGFRFKPSSL
jgi:outer membrane receptor for ferrienterochelin and colicins